MIFRVFLHIYITSNSVKTVKPSHLTRGKLKVGFLFGNLRMKCSFIGIIKGKHIRRRAAKVITSSSSKFNDIKYDDMQIHLKKSSQFKTISLTHTTLLFYGFFFLLFCVYCEIVIIPRYLLYLRANRRNREVRRHGEESWLIGRTFMTAK